MRLFTCRRYSILGSATTHTLSKHFSYIPIIAHTGKFVKGRFVCVAAGNIILHSPEAEPIVWLLPVSSNPNAQNLPNKNREVLLHSRLFENGPQRYPLDKQTNNTQTPEVTAKITWLNDEPQASKRASANITIGIHDKMNKIESNKQITFFIKLLQ